jgi:hypothetical protein
LPPIRRQKFEVTCATRTCSGVPSSRRSGDAVCQIRREILEGFLGAVAQIHEIFVRHGQLFSEHAGLDLQCSIGSGFMP